MRRMLEYAWAGGLVCLALAVVLGTAALTDHRQKTSRMDRVELAEWFCTHQGTSCGEEPSSAAIERAWNRREVGYEVAVPLLAALGAGGFLASARRRLALIGARGRRAGRRASAEAGARRDARS